MWRRPQALPLLSELPSSGELSWTKRRARMVVLSSAAMFSTFDLSRSHMPSAVAQRRAILSTDLVVYTSQRPSVAMTCAQSVDEFPTDARSGAAVDDVRQTCRLP